MKAQIQERQKLYHKEPNSSNYIPDFEDIKYDEIYLDYPELEHGLLKEMKKYTIHNPTSFHIPDNYIITEEDLHYIDKYTIGISRTKIKDQDV
jgi:hypothetical protein